MSKPVWPDVHLRSLAVAFSFAGLLVAATALLFGGGFAAGARSGESARDPSVQPFSSESIWNTPLGRGAVFQDPAAPETAMLRSENVGGQASSYSWISGDGLRIFRQKASDPLVRWYYDGRSATAPWPNEGALQHSSFMLRTPPDVEFLGADRYTVIVTDDAKFAYEVWLGSHDKAANAYRVRYIVGTDLYGPGIARKDHTSEGIRAFGGSLLGGLIRCNELDTLFIPHGLAMVLSPTQLKAGHTAADQKVWPASTTDNDGHNPYSGLVPMGALVAIPPSVNLQRLGLSPEGLALARAYQEFGGYVVDTAPKTMIIGNAEAGCKPEHIQRLQHDKRTIMQQLTLVTNNDSNSPGGPGERVTRFPPPLLK